MAVYLDENEYNEVSGVMNAVSEDVQTCQSVAGKNTYVFATTPCSDVNTIIGSRAGYIKRRLSECTTKLRALNTCIVEYVSGVTDVRTAIANVDEEAYDILSTAHSNMSVSDEYSNLPTSTKLSILKGDTTLANETSGDRAEYNYAKKYLEDNGITDVTASELATIASQYGMTVEEWLNSTNVVAARNYGHLSLAQYIARNMKWDETSIKPNEAMAAYVETSGTISTSTGTSVMDSFSQFQGTGDNDYTKFKTLEPIYNVYNNGAYIFGSGTPQDKIQKMAQTDSSSGIRYVTVDGLTNEDGSSAKVYCVATGTLLAQAASTTGDVECGGVLKVTWEDGTYDYLVVGDTKGTTTYGQTAGYCYTNSGKEVLASEVTKVNDNYGKIPATGEIAYYTYWSNAIELITDPYAGDSSMRQVGVLGREDTMYQLSSTGLHWAQSFTNIEVMDINVLK